MSCAMIKKADGSTGSLHDSDGLERSNEWCKEKPNLDKEEENKGGNMFMLGELKDMMVWASDMMTKLFLFKMLCHS